MTLVSTMLNVLELIILVKRKKERKSDDDDIEDVPQCVALVVSEADTINDAYSKFKTTLLRHTVHRPPFSIALFTFEESRAISCFVSENFFSRFDLLRYCYCPNAVLDLAINLNMNDQESEDNCRPLAEEKTAQVILR